MVVSRKWSFPTALLDQMYRAVRMAEGAFPPLPFWTRSQERNTSPLPEDSRPRSQQDLQRHGSACATRLLGMACNEKATFVPVSRTQLGWCSRVPGLTSWEEPLSGKWKCESFFCADPFNTWDRRLAELTEVVDMRRIRSEAWPEEAAEDQVLGMNRGLGNVSRRKATRARGLFAENQQDFDILASYSLLFTSGNPPPFYLFGRQCMRTSQSFRGTCGS